MQDYLEALRHPMPGPRLSPRARMVWTMGILITLLLVGLSLD